MRPSWILSEEERIRRFHGRGRSSSGKCDAGGGGGTEHEDAVMNTGSAVSVPNVLLPRADLMCPAPIGPPLESSRQLGAAERLRILQYGEVMRRCCSGRHDDLEPALLDSLVHNQATKWNHSTCRCWARCHRMQARCTSRQHC